MLVSSTSEVYIDCPARPSVLMSLSPVDVVVVAVVVVVVVIGIFVLLFSQSINE